MVTQDKRENKVLLAEITLGRLRELQKAYVGGPIPEWMKINEWGTALSELAGDAADLIEWYQSGKVPGQVRCGFCNSVGSPESGIDFDWSALQELRKQSKY